MKRYEVESFVKSFSIYFVSLTILLSIVTYFYYKEGVHRINDRLKYEMTVYNYNFKNSKFSIDFVEQNSTKEFGKLNFNPNEVYMIFPVNGIKSKVRLKVIYPKSSYNKEIEGLKIDILIKYIVALLILLIFSIFYATYALYPLKNALNLLNEFLKDIIHDLNTPVASLLINSKMLKSGKSSKGAVDRIELSAKTISSLYKNLEYYIRDIPVQKEEVALKDVIKQRVEYFKLIYPHINFKLNLEDKICHCSKEAFIRIIDNLISNSCKYNKPPNIVEITMSRDKIVVKDSGVGIKSVKNVFKRYYKESDRGLGIGLNIVKKLCDIMGIIIDIKSRVGETVVELRFKEGLK